MKIKEVCTYPFIDSHHEFLWFAFSFSVYVGVQYWWKWDMTRSVQPHYAGQRELNFLCGIHFISSSHLTPTCLPWGLWFFVPQEQAADYTQQTFFLSTLQTMFYLADLAWEYGTGEEEKPVYRLPMHSKTYLENLCLCCSANIIFSFPTIKL